jgi:hypothetical protein
MKSLIAINRAAITALSFLVSPAGLLSFICLCATVEGLGISLFFSGLFVEKFKSYALATGFGHQELAAFVSLIAGAGLAFLMMLGVLLLKLIGKGGYSIAMSLAFALLSVVTYWIALDVSKQFSVMNLFGVCLLVLAPSSLGAIASLHLAEIILASTIFNELQKSIFQKASKFSVAAKADAEIDLSNFISEKPKQQPFLQKNRPTLN